MKSWIQASVFTAFFALGCEDPDVTHEDFTAFISPPRSADGRAPCRDRSALRNAFFGDLHVHTALSSDAWNYDVRVRPSEAYGYAFGDAIRIPPNDKKGRGLRVARIDRPLDFAAITDHAEFLGETSLCANSESEVYDSENCQKIRNSETPLDHPLAFKLFWPWPSRSADVCGEDGRICEEEERNVWSEIINAAQEWNDTSADCARTTFIAFEYSSLRLGSNLHRNVIFRNENVLSQPVSYMDAQREWELWEILRVACVDSDTGCDAISIPHNSNISNGRMFSIDYPGTDGVDQERARAQLRARIEPLVEVMQHKGDSECRRQIPNILGGIDEACGFEKFEDMRHIDSQGNPKEPEECMEFMSDLIPKLGPGACVHHRNYVRYVLTEGLAEQARLGVNPFRLGLIASTDTHNGVAGGVNERTWRGHLGIADASFQDRLIEEAGGMAGMAYNPGGLVGVWAEENSREAVFDALARREVFGTSGPRIQPRLFGSWSYRGDLCESQDRIAQADRTGVPMGGELPDGFSSQGPAFMALAWADPGTTDTPGGDLERIQIIKGWVDDQGDLHQAVYEVAGGPTGATVDTASCEVKGKGFRELCGVWRDPEFDPERAAVYYARVLETPSCRYSAHECASLPVGERPLGCAHRVMQASQQERAWTSPIWFTPRSFQEESETGDGA
ncbi:MAG: hypothetical protein CL917_11830 [Deltaproteobacteria bacterium]|nr:hypothetical protein [Deltaproteobacteria bacterium]